MIVTTQAPFRVQTSACPSRILVVEDEFVIAENLKDILRDMGHLVAGTADSAWEALRLLETEPVDLVLMDIRLRGDEDGIQLADLLQKTYRIPFIFVTSYADEATLGRIRLLQPCGYVVKPFRSQDIYAAVELALQSRAPQDRSGRERDLGTLLGMSQTIAGIRDKRDLLRLVIEKIKPVFNFYDCGIMLLDQAGKSYYDLAVRMPDIDGSAADAHLHAAGLYAGGGLPYAGSVLEYCIGQAERAGKPVIFDYGQDYQGYSDGAVLHTLQELGYQEGLATVLKTGGRLMGAFFINARQRNFFSPGQFPSFQAVADLVAVAVANIQANEEVLEREREKSVLLSISHAIASIHKKEELLKVIFRQIQPLFGFYDVGLAVISFSDNTVTDWSALLPDTSPSEVNQALHQAALFTLPYRGSAIETISARIEKEGRPVILPISQDSIRQFPDFKEVLEIELAHGYREMWFTNLKAGGRLLGTLNFNSVKPDYFGRFDSRFFQAIADQIAVAVSNILANEEILEREREKALLLSLSEDMATIRDRDNLWQVMMEKIRPLFGFDDAVVTVVDWAQNAHYILLISSPHWREQCREYASVVATKYPLAGSAIGWIDEKLRQQDTLVLPMREVVERFPEDEAFRLVASMGVQQMLWTVLRHGNRVLGSLNLHANDPLAFDRVQLPLVEAVADQVAVAVANILANEEILEREREKSLQLAVNNALVTLKDFEDLSHRIATEVNALVPFDTFSLRICTKQHRLKKYVIFEKDAGGRFGNITKSIQRQLPQVEQLEAQELHLQPGEAYLLNGDAFLERAQTQPLYQFAHQVYGLQSALFVPLSLPNYGTAVIRLGSRASNGFSNGALSVISSFALQLSLAVENQLAYEEKEEQEQQKSMQLNVVNALAALKEQDAIIETIAEEINRVIGCEFVNLIAFRGDTLPLDHNYAAIKKERRFSRLTKKHFLLSQNMDEGALRREETQIKVICAEPGIYTDETLQELCNRYTLPRIARYAFGIKSLMYIPLASGGQVIGTLVVGSIHPFAFTAQDLLVMEELAAQMSVVTDNFLAYQEIEKLKSQLELEKIYLTEEIRLTHNFEEIIGQTAPMQQVFKQISQVAATVATTLILGETGTGKELIARAIHNRSPRKARPLVKVNCASLPAQLIESELFGHEKGSFTGATERRIGKFELAHGGTIFLDEIGELPLELQAKLLRVLQEKEIERIGGKALITCDVRVIAATNRNLEKEVAEGRFRTDLFWRLNVFPITLSPLRQRKEDIPLLVTHFLDKLSKKHGKKSTRITTVDMNTLVHNDWPGNIRELEHTIERAVILSEGPTLNFNFLYYKEAPRVPSTRKPVELKSLEDAERELILAALRKTNGRIRGEGGTAEILKIHPCTLDARMRKLGISRSDAFKEE